MRLRRYTQAYLVAAATLIASHGAVAQATRDSIGPRQGTWGVEASYGSFTGASLLRFSSPRAAWMLGASFALGQETSDETVDFLGNTTRRTSTLGTVEVRVARRWWTGELTEAMRPFVGLGLGGRYSTVSSARQTAGSVIGELGATYFFGPHVSLGGAGELAVVREHDRFDSLNGPVLKQDSWSVRGNVARLTAAVYF
jgi:hypothetical protein